MSKATSNQHYKNINVPHEVGQVFDRMRVDASRELPFDFTNQQFMLMLIDAYKRKEEVE